MTQVTIDQAIQIARRHHQAGRLPEAEAIYRQVLSQNPNHVEALNLLGTLAAQMGRLDAGMELLRRAVRLKPDFAEAHNNLALVLQNAGQLDAAIAAWRQAIALRPNYAAAHSNLGNAFRILGQFDQAIACYRQAIRFKPEFPDAHNNLAVALKAAGQLDDAIASFRLAIRLKPDYAVAHSNLGNALKDAGHFDEAIASHRLALQLNPDSAQAHNNLASVLKEIGQHDQAIAAFRQAIQLKPDFAEAHGSLIHELYCLSDHDPAMILEEHRRWDHQHAEPLKKFIQPHSNHRDPDRRLKLGYVSPDFSTHPVGRFLLPLLEHHDHQQFEIFCYSDVPAPDAITARFRSIADHWQEIRNSSVEHVAERIRADGIDLLVDLSGHTAGNRLLVFARKPAPVQVSYLGYPGTTGLSTIDYRLTDRWADPPGLTDRFHTETLFRLPQTNWCYAEPEDSPPVQPPPAISRGHVTFGSFNHFAKATDAMLQIWGRILHEVPGSRLILKTFAFGASSVRDRVRRNFAAQGIGADRLDLRGPQPDRLSHLALYDEMDIALDTFPYHGTTTTCEALWMGVPVVTLVGPSHVSRVGLSLLSTIGLPDLAATTPDEYVKLAVALAADQDRLKALRDSLRERMRSSPLMDAPCFARDVEAAYRQMWRNWCAAEKTS